MRRRITAPSPDDDADASGVWTGTDVRDGGGSATATVLVSGTGAFGSSNVPPSPLRQWVDDEIRCRPPRPAGRSLDRPSRTAPRSRICDRHGRRSHFDWRSILRRQQQRYADPDLRRRRVRTRRIGACAEQRRHAHGYGRRPVVRGGSGSRLHGHRAPQAPGKEPPTSSDVSGCAIGQRAFVVSPWSPIRRGQTTPGIIVATPLGDAPFPSSVTSTSRRAGVLLTRKRAILPIRVRGRGWSNGNWTEPLACLNFASSDSIPGSPPVTDRSRRCAS